MKKWPGVLALIASIAFGAAAIARDVAPPAPRLGDEPPEIAARPNPAEQREILLLFSEDPTQPWTQRIAEGVGEVAMRETPGTVLYFEYMDAARFREPTGFEHFRDWLKTKYADRDIDVIVPVGDPAMAFTAQYHDTLWPVADVYFLALQQPGEPFRARLPHAGGLVMEDTLLPTIRVLKAALPGTKHLALIRGLSASERAWAAPVPGTVNALGLDLIDVPSRTFPELLKNVASLPENTLILILGPLVDAAGRVTLAHSLCTEISSVATGPTILPGSHFIGCGVIGGVLRDFTRVGRRIATDVLGPPERLRGSINLLPLAEFTTAVFDARQLERWGVSESRLPAGSQILFREPNLWRDYQVAVLLAIGAMLFQGALIVGLLYERRRRMLAEQASRRDLVVAARAARVTAMGELTASIAHELAQPLGAILHNIEAMKLMVASKRAPAEEMVEIIDDVAKQDLRAREILTRIRALVQKRELEASPVDLNELVDDSLRLMAHEATGRGIQIERDLMTPPCIVFGDRVHLQQVVINLVLNAMEALTDIPSSRRRLLVRTTSDATGSVLSVHDDGPGVDAAIAARLFEPFVTTKPQGLGIGLSIVRSIVTAHAGEIDISSQPGGGTTARVRLPPCAVA